MTTYFYSLKDDDGPFVFQARSDYEAKCWARDIFGKNLLAVWVPSRVIYEA